jgi:hypothetical protein
MQRGHVAYPFGNCLLEQFVVVLLCFQLLSTELLFYLAFLGCHGHYTTSYESKRMQIFTKQQWM